ncbi:uncharacterized protein AMSG_04663, partial [Thecamonas trahens ATCC 50062]
MDMEFPTESSDLLSMCLFPQSSEATPMATTGGEAPLDPLDFLLDAPADQLKSGGEPMPPRGTLAAAGLSLDLPAVGAANGLDLDSYLMGDGSGLGLGLGLSPAGLGVADSGTSPLTMGLEPMLTSSATPRTLSASASPEPETKPRFQASKSPDPSRVAPQSTPSPDRERHSESSEDEASLSSSPRTSKAGTGKAPQASRKRKRSATKTSPASGPNAPISREELLDLVSKGLPKHLLKDNLTPAEQRELKRQRRLIKNRESAHNSRRRKKDYLNHLETKVASLEGDNAELRRKVHELQNHTHALEAEIAHLRAANPKAAAAYAASPQGLAAPVHSPFSSPGAFASARAAAAAAASAASGAPSGSGMSTNMKAASVCLMVMLFSFGLFFNGQQPLASLA